MSDISPQLQRFLRDFVGSYEELEILLWLARPPLVQRTQNEIAVSLNVALDAADAGLQALQATGGLLRTEERAGLTYFQYEPATAEVASLVEQLQRAYQEQRLAIIKLMSANALERVRGAAARRLADAFRLERPKK